MGVTRSEVFESWMAEHRGVIVKIVRSFTTDPRDGEDLFQEITVAIWRSIPSFRGDSKPSTWIWRIALNRAISWRRTLSPPHTDIETTAELHAVERADDGLLVDHVYTAIRTLPLIDRSLIVLSLEGYSYEEISEVTGLTQTNVGARLSRARARIAHQMEGTR